MKYSCVRLYCVIHKNSLLLNQHNGDDAPQNDMFSSYSMGSHIVYICCVEMKSFKLIKCLIIRYLIIERFINLND